MFLNFLIDSKHQELFLELATIITIVDIEEDALVSEDDNTFLSYVDHKEKAMLEMYSGEMNNTRLLGKAGLERGMHSVLGDRGMFSGYKPNNVDSYLEQFARRMHNISEEIVDANTNNPEIKKEIMLSLAEKLDDISNVDQEMIRAEVRKQPGIREQIIQKSIITAINNDDLPDLTIEQKKAILFELIAIASIDGTFSDQEKKAILEITDRLSLESELIDEFSETIVKINAAVNDALEIITE